MHIRKLEASNDSFPVLDDEFDKFSSIPAGEQMPRLHLCLCDDLSWEDQLNDGTELSV